MELNLKLNGENLETVLHAAVLQALGDPAKQAIIDDVVKYLVTDGPTSSYSNQKQPSPLKAAVYRAAQSIATKLIEDQLVNDPEFVGQVTELYREAWQKLFKGDAREKLVEKISNAMYDALHQRY